MNTIRNVILENGRTVQSTVYNEESPMLDYMIPTAGTWGLHTEDLQRGAYDRLAEYREREKAHMDEARWKWLDRQEKEYTKITTDMIRGGMAPEDPEVVEVGRKKAEVRQEKKQLKEDTRRLSLDDVFGKEVTEVSSVYYKDSMATVDFSELQACHEAWKGEEYALPAERPWFVSNLERLKELLGKKGPVGIEGGSCLLGTDEMHFLFEMENGEIRRFDFNIMQEIKPGREFTPEASSELYDFIRAEGKGIVKASIECPKTKVTVDEYEAVRFIFMIAQGLDARVIITIPDMSYDKTFVALFSGLDTAIYQPFHDKFLEECRRLSEVSIQMIDGLAEQYRVKDYEIFYSGNTEKCRIFEAEKKAFFEKYKKKEKLTTRSGMEGALMDYICMPAMPFYFYGVKDVIEVNRLEEYPSMEKCRRVHRSAFRLYEMLYPQRIGKNGKTSGFYGKFEEKEFIE